MTLNSLKAKLAKQLLTLEKKALKGFQRFLFSDLSKADTKEIKRIIIYRIGNIGDTVLALPAIAKVRSLYPKAKITLLTATGNITLDQQANIGQVPIGAESVLAAYPKLVNQTVCYTPNEIKQPQSRLALKNRLTEKGTPDLFISLPVSMQTSYRAAREMAFAKWLGATYATGFDLIFPEIFNTEFSQAYPEAIPQTHEWLYEQVASIEGTEPIEAPVPQTDPDILHKLELEGPLLLVNPGAKLGIKQWPWQHYAEALKIFHETYHGVHIVLLGTLHEKALNDKIMLASGLIEINTKDKKPKKKPPISNLAGLLNIQHTISLLKASDAILTNDTGTMHLAALTNTPSVVPMGGQFPEKLWNPPTQNTTLLRNKVPCAPCFCDACPLPVQTCLIEISPDLVAAELANLFEPLGELAKPPKKKARSKKVVEAENAATLELESSETDTTPEAVSMATSPQTAG